MNTYRNKLKAGALYYVIFLSFVLFTFGTLFIGLRFLKLRQTQEEIRYFTTKDDVKSAILLYLSEPEKYQNLDTVNIDLFQDSTRSVKIQKEYWGIIPFITAHSYYKGKSISKSLTIGKDPFNSDSIALWVADNSQSIYASGTTQIRGNVFVPAKGVQRASIEGKNLITDQVIDGTIKLSSSSLPRINTNIEKQIKSCLNFDNLKRNSQNINRLNLSLLSQPLLDEPIYYYSEKDIQLSEIELNGKIGIISEGTILIKSDVILNGSLIAAKNIIIEEGFSGKTQLFAKDSFLIGSNCVLEFPSVVCVYNENVNPIYAEVGENSKIFGSIIVNQENLSTKEPGLILCNGSEVTGIIYHNGTIELEGKIYGSLYTKKFYSKTRKAFYYNHLIDNEINYHKIPEHFVLMDIINGYNDQIQEYIR